MSVDDVDMLVFTFTEVGVDYHGAIVAAVNEIGVIAIALHGTDYTFKLPRRCRGRGIEEMPTDVDLEGSILIGLNDIAIACKIHSPVIIPKYGLGRSSKYGDLGFHRNDDSSVWGEKQQSSVLVRCNCFLTELTEVAD